MKVRGSMSRLFFTLLLVLCISFSALADTIRLKDGSIIKGKITGFSDGKFTISVGEGSRQRIITYDASEVDSIHFDTDLSASSRPSVRVITSDTTASSQPKQSSSRVIVTDNTGKIPSKPPVQQSEPEEDVIIEDEETVARTDDTVSPPATSAPVVRTSSAEPITITINVLADNSSNGWTNSGWIVKKGQRIRIIGSGEVSLGKGKTSGAAGLYDLDDNEKLLKAVPTGALIAVIGDDNNDFIYIGSDREFIAERDGALFLGINEGNLNDNTGSLQAKIEIMP